MPRWVGRCPECEEWGTVVEEPVERVLRVAKDVATERLTAHDAAAAERIATGHEEIDRVLGGGIVPGSIVLVAGEPGVGKSTLMLQAALALGLHHEVLLVCGEEAPAQVRARAARLGSIPAGVSTLADPQLGSVLGALDGSAASVLVVDSVQTLFDPDIPSAPGSVSQVRECGARLARAARDRGCTVLLVGHVTKEGAVAGPRILEHLVDVVLQFEGDRSSGLRILRALKNRFGTTQEVGFFEMRNEGLVAIRDASAHLLADRCAGLPGSVLAACVDGRRPFVCEVQALVTDTKYPPRRTGIGVDGSRLPFLVAVLHQRAQVRFDERDVYVSAVGGMSVAEPACDLPITLALLSARFEIALPESAVAFGEIGLAGEVRQVVGTERRIAEARSVGCDRIFVPHNFAGCIDGMQVHRLRHVRDALDGISNGW